MAVDDGHRRAELVGCHGDEIALQQRQPLLLRQLLGQHRRLARQHALAAHQLDGVVAEHHGGLRHLADLVGAPGFRNIDIGVVGGQPAHAVGQLQQRAGDGAADMKQRGDHHHARDRHGEENEPERLAVRHRETIAGDLRAGDRLIGELAERVAGGVIGDARGAAVDRQRLGLAIAARQHQHLVDDLAIVGPVRLEPVVQIVLGRIVRDLLKTALGLRDRAVELRHVGFGRGDLGLIGRQQIAAFDGAEIRGEIVEVAEHAGGRQPDLGDVRGQPVEIAQPPDAERAQHADQQEKNQKHAGKVMANRLRPPRQASPPHGKNMHLQTGVSLDLTEL